MSPSVYMTGLSMGLGLIVAIGAQNAFVLRQGLKREHVLPVVLACALSDALLIALGVTSLAQVIALMPWLEPAMRYGGAAFLLWYALRSLRSAMTSTDALKVDNGIGTPLKATLATCLALTWLNPHVWLDTVGLLGAISAQYAPHGLAFGIAAALGSASFFSALGFGARALAPVFARPQAWVRLEIGVGLTMWALAAGLAFS